MTERYVAKVVKVIDDYSIAVNKGSTEGMVVGERFVVVGLGESIRDPDTNEDLGCLEIVKGMVEVSHVQERIASLRSCKFSKVPDRREIKKVTSNSGGSQARILSIFGNQDVTTESITPGDTLLEKLDNVQVGDLLIRKQ